MSPILGLVLLGVASVHCASVSINDVVDQKLALMNRVAVTSSKTTADFGSGQIYAFSYEGATAIGLDSLYRVGECTMDVGRSSITYKYNVSQNIHAVYFRRLTVLDKSGSGYYRAFGNSLAFSYTVDYAANRCTVRAGDIKLALDKVEACWRTKCINSTTDPDFADFVKTQLTPLLNSKVNDQSLAIEQALDRSYCGTNSYVALENSNLEQANENMITLGLEVLYTSLFGL